MKTYFAFTVLVITAAAQGTLPITTGGVTIPILTSTQQHFTNPVQPPATGTEIPSTTSSGPISLPITSSVSSVTTTASGTSSDTSATSASAGSTSSVVVSSSSESSSSTSSLAPTSSGTSPLTSPTGAAPNTGSSGAYHNTAPKVALLLPVLGLLFMYN